MALLPLAVDIAETVSRASTQRRSVNVESEAARLLQNHPEADITEEEVADALHDEVIDAEASRRESQQTDTATFGGSWRTRSGAPGPRRTTVSRRA